MGSRKAVPWLLPFLAGLPLTAAQPSPAAQAWNLLHTGASDSRAEVRQQAAAALGSMTGISEAVGLLEKLLRQDEEADVRQTAAAGLGAMKARTAIPYLKDALDDPDLGVSYAAVRSLWDMGDLSGRQKSRSHPKQAPRRLKRRPAQTDRSRQTQDPQPVGFSPHHARQRLRSDPRSLRHRLQRSQGPAKRQRRHKPGLRCGHAQPPLRQRIPASS